MREGSLLLLACLEMLKMDSLGYFLRVFMGLIPIVVEGIYGRNWLACLIGRICCGALGDTSTSLDFPAKD